MGTIETKSERVTARITPKLKSFLKQAADLRGRSLTDFIVESAQKEAENIVEKGLLIQFTIEQQDQIIEALLHPSEPNEVLKQAAHFYDDADISSR
jgi:uncharacterized protein (DUF1778 family)